MGIGNLIVVIVDKYKEKIVIDKALSFGVDFGITLIGHGTGDKNQLKVLGITIEPEKRMLLLLCKKECTNEILEEFNKELNLEGINKGIAFVLPIKNSIGWES